MSTTKKVVANAEPTEEEDKEEEDAADPMRATKYGELEAFHKIEALLSDFDKDS